MSNERKPTIILRRRADGGLIQAEAEAPLEGTRVLVHDPGQGSISPWCLPVRPLSAEMEAAVARYDAGHVPHTEEQPQPQPEQSEQPQQPQPQQPQRASVIAEVRAFVQEIEQFIFGDEPEAVPAPSMDPAAMGRKLEDLAAPTVAALPDELKENGHLDYRHIIPLMQQADIVPDWNATESECVGVGIQVEMVARATNSPLAGKIDAWAAIDAVTRFVMLSRAVALTDFLALAETYMYDIEGDVRHYTQVVDPRIVQLSETYGFIEIMHREDEDPILSVTREGVLAEPIPAVRIGMGWHDMDTEEIITRIEEVRRCHDE